LAKCHKKSVGGRGGRVTKRERKSSRKKIEKGRRPVEEWTERWKTLIKKRYVARQTYKKTVKQ